MGDRTGLILLANPIIDSAPFRLESHDQKLSESALGIGARVYFPETPQQASWHTFQQHADRYAAIQDVFVNSNCKELDLVPGQAAIWSRFEVIYPVVHDSFLAFPSRYVVDYCLVPPAQTPSEQPPQIRPPSYLRGDPMPFALAMVPLPSRTKRAFMTPNALFERDLFPRLCGDSVCLEIGIASDGPGGRPCAEEQGPMYDSLRCKTSTLCSKIGGKPGQFDDRFQVRLTSQFVKAAE